MNGNGGLSAGDVLALSKNNDGIFGGDGFAGIIMLLIVAGLFGGAGFGWSGNNAGITETFMDNRLLARDVFNTNTNVLESACQTQRDVLESKYASQVSDCGLSKEIMQNRYDNALQTQTISAQMNECCCQTKELIIQENQKTRDLIQANYIEGLRTALSDAKAEISNRDQSSYILNTMGRWHGYPSCGCNLTGCTYTQNLI